jgi:hypothetical protein
MARNEWTCTCGHTVETHAKRPKPPYNGKCRFDGCPCEDFEKQPRPWNDLPQDRKEAFIELLVMESEGGGWIPEDLFNEEPEEAEAQVEAIKAAIVLLRGTL